MDSAITVLPEQLEPTTTTRRIGTVLEFAAPNSYRLRKIDRRVHKKIIAIPGKINCKLGVGWNGVGKPTDAADRPVLRPIPWAKDR
jgi:hypothetical protein